jgi:hypothetical protein
MAMELILRLALTEALLFGGYLPAKQKSASQCPLCLCGEKTLKSQGIIFRSTSQTPFLVKDPQ